MRLYTLFIILFLIMMVFPSCEDSFNSLYIAGVVSFKGDADKCDLGFSNESGSKSTLLSEGLLDLPYNKLAHVKDGMYGYIMRLGLVNKLPVAESSNVNGNINDIHVKKAKVDIYNDAGRKLTTEDLILDTLITSDSIAIVNVRLLNEATYWTKDLTTGEFDYSKDTWYSLVYDPTDKRGNGGLGTSYLIVKVTLEGETLGGEPITSNTFEFKINLCINCLLCPFGFCNQVPTTLSEYCSQNGADNSKFNFSCYGAQDEAPLCLEYE